MWNRLRASLKYRSERLRTKALRALWFKDLDVSAEEAGSCVFCFLGEFSLEIMIWAPYLHYLKSRFGFKMKVLGRKGGRLFYSFADEYVEIPSKHFTGTGVGHLFAYDKLRREMGLKKMFCPLEDAPSSYGENMRALAVNGCAMLSSEYITAGFDASHWLALDLGGIKDELPFKFSKPLVAIANKHYSQWGPMRIRNFYNKDELRTLRDFLLARGFAVVYNCFPEPPNEKENSVCDVSANDVFNVPDTYDFSKIYRSEPSVERQNRLQISLFNSCFAVASAQGGASALPILCKKPVFILMRQGYYNEHTTQSRLCGNPDVEMFYSPKQMLMRLEEFFAEKGIQRRG